MLKNKKLRRIFVAVLMIMGAILIFLATEAMAGYLLVVLGVLIELISIKLGHK
jgi:hypothetical protein